MLNKKELTESDICDLYITPAIKAAGWDSFKQIRREVTLTPGPIIVRGEEVQQLPQQVSPLQTRVQQSNTYAQQLLQTVLEGAFEGKGYEVEEEEVLNLVAAER